MCVVSSGLVVSKGKPRRSMKVKSTIGVPSSFMKQTVSDTHCCSRDTYYMLMMNVGPVAANSCGLLRHLDKSEEMRVSLHLPACELKTVFFLPAVVLVGGEELVEL